MDDKNPNDANKRIYSILHKWGIHLRDNEVLSYVDEMILNVFLQEALKPYQDDDTRRVDFTRMSLSEENKYLLQMLEWEMAPVLPIASWFSPVLSPLPASELSDTDLKAELDSLILKLYDKNVVLVFTTHLSDRELYALIIRQILPSYQKMIVQEGEFHYWNCSCTGKDDADREVWLTYYATDEERGLAYEEYGELPQRQDPPFPRRLPGEDGFMPNISLF